MLINININNISNNVLLIMCVIMIILLYNIMWYY